VLVQQVVLPGVGVYVALPRDFGVLAGVHQGFSPVPPGGSSTPQPEKSVNYEVGARWAPKKVRVEWIGFFNDYENLSDICTFSSGCLDENLDRQFDAGSARVFGFEAFAESELSVTEEVKLPGRVAYTYTNATFATDFVSADPIFGDVTEGDELPYVPEHQLGAAMGVEVVGVGGLHVGASYVDAMREVAGQGPAAPGTETDAVFLLDLSVAATPLSWLTIYGTVDNLLDDAHLVSRRPFGARPGAPRWFHFGTKLRY
jgi:Fe(3+) dicitrate transport protein